MRQQKHVTYKSEFVEINFRHLKIYVVISNLLVCARGNTPSIDIKAFVSRPFDSGSDADEAIVGAESTDTSALVGLEGGSYLGRLLGSLVSLTLQFTQT